MPYDLTRIAPACITLTWIYMAAEAVFFAVTFWETGFYRGDFAAGPEIDVDYYALDLAILIGALGMLGAALAAYVMNGIWVYRAVSNARVLDPNPDRISPGWAIGWHVIPIANLWMPFRAIKQTWNTSTVIGRDMNTAVGHPFAIWWTCWIISSLIDNGSLRISMRAQTNEDWLTVGYLDMSSSVFSIVAGYFFLQILREITRAQAEQSGVAEIFS